MPAYFRNFVCSCRYQHVVVGIWAQSLLTVFNLRTHQPSRWAKIGFVSYFMIYFFDLAMSLQTSNVLKFFCGSTMLRCEQKLQQREPFLHVGKPNKAGFFFIFFILSCRNVSIGHSCLHSPGEDAPQGHLIRPDAHIHSSLKTQPEEKKMPVSANSFIVSRQLMGD